MLEESWNLFRMTGSVTDYLKYRQEVEQVRREEDNGEQYHCHGNDTFRNANERIR
ncbi:MAG: hypothetical protein MR355_05235 [Lachnospiraceae bacterium]|nr:hypothetical protein [Lachnospiraceae bacterium]